MKLTDENGEEWETLEHDVKADPYCVHCPECRKNSLCIRKLEKPKENPMPEIVAGYLISYAQGFYYVVIKTERRKDGSVWNMHHTNHEGIFWRPQFSTAEVANHDFEIIWSREGK